MKDESIKIRCSSQEKASIQKMADAQGKPVSRYLLEQAFKGENGAPRPVKPVSLSSCWYKGLVFHFTLEVDEDELVIVGRIYKDKAEIKTGLKLIFGRGREEILRYADEARALAMVGAWMQSLDAKGDNPFVKYMQE